MLLLTMCLRQTRGFTMDYLSRVPEVKDTVDKQSLLNHLCTHVVDRFSDSTDLFSEIPAISRAAKVAHYISWATGQGHPLWGGADIVKNIGAPQS